MLSNDDKYILRILFKNQLYKADGQAFEDIFRSIMNYAEPGFMPVKPWGNIGDRKNDGYIPDKGIFFQIFAPEDIRKSYPNVVSKLKTDFSGLMKQWNPVYEFYFVVNDKYKGLHADSIQTITEIVNDNHLRAGGFKTAKDLENLLFSLDENQIKMVAGNPPDPANISVLDYSVLNETIDHIMKLPLPIGEQPLVKLPDWDEKIQFNNLTEATKRYLGNGY